MSTAKYVGDDLRFIIALGGAILLGPASLAIFMPAVPAIRADFGVDLQTAQLSLTLPLLAILLTPLIVGRLVDKIGRRPVMLICISLVIAGCIFCIVAWEYWMLVSGRVFVGVFSSACMIIGRAIVGDVYSGPNLARMAARYTVPPVIGIMLAPLLGAYIIESMGWRETFWLVLIFSFFLLYLTWRSLPETHVKKTEESADDMNIKLVFRSSALWGYFGQSSFHYAVAFSFAAVAPHIMVQHLEAGIKAYAIGLLAVVFGLLSGIVAAERIKTRLQLGTMVLLSSLLGALLGLTSVLSIIVLSIPLSSVSLFVPAILVAFSIGLAMPYSQAGILSTVPSQAGTASGISTALQMLMAAVFTHIVAIPWLEPHLSVALISTLAMLLASAFAVMAYRGAPQETLAEEI